MSLANAGTFLVVASLKNRIARQLRRLREPRYLVATIAGGAYFWSILMRRDHAVATPAGVDALPIVELVLAALSILAILSAWIFGSDEGALRFTEAEIQFFFPAPISRRALLHYKLVRTLLVTGLSALLLSLIGVGRLASHRAFFLVGAWLEVGTLAMHWTAASLMRASLAAHGASALRRRGLALAILGGFAVALGVGVVRAPMPAAATLPALGAWAIGLMRSPPLAWVLLPVLAPIRVALAQTVAGFLTALPVAVLVAAVHYAWAVSSSVAFEQASVEQAERRARGLEGQRGARILRRGEPLFRLTVPGAPWVGLFWKNLVAAIRLLSLRLLIALALVMVLGAMMAFGVLGPGARAGVLGGACAAAAAFLALLGPQVFRIDLRLDLPRVDLLRSYPLRGRDVVLAEVLAPATVLAAAEWLFLLAATVLSLGLAIPGLEGLGRLAALLAAGVLLPTLTACGLLVQNAAVLLFPGWVGGTETPQRGIEAMGQRLLTLAGSLVVVAFGLVPAGVVGAVVAAISWSPLGPFAVPLASAVAALVVAAEIHLVLGLLGRAFERFDLTQ